MSVRVLVVDDHPIVREGLQALLKSLGFEIVGVAPDGETAIRDVRLLQPEVVLMDVRMPGIGGVEAARRIKQSSPQVRVLMLTMYDDDATVFTAMRAGAVGYLLKGATQVEISAAIRSAASGQMVFGPGVATRVLEFFDTTGPGSGPDPFPELTDRERDILDLLAAGRRTAEIAAALYLSPKTVSNNLTTIFVKLAVTDRAQAIIRAREGGLGR